jgi:putative ABC transport system permease protein
MLLAQAMSRVLGGLAVGLLSAWWLARWLESMLFGVRPHDPATYAAVAGVLIAASLVAVAIPARRALKVDAARAIRME